jgi:hypothetical protein
MEATSISQSTGTLERAEAAIARLDELDVRIQQRTATLLSREQNEIAGRFFRDRKRERHVALDRHRQYVAEGGSPEAFTYPAN